ncbi:hypothetical protein GF345_05360 [Candidatus Woesearchaeota archaeon]|nr:hypothetical protein [Candidatus Woesearchaeota archaeon]
MRYLTVFLALMLILPTVLADDYIFEGWVTTGDSFEVNGDAYLVSQGVTATSAIIMGPSGVHVIDEDECITANKMRFCVDDFKYTIGGNVTIHGSDTQDFYITVSEPGADLDVEIDAEPSDIMIDDTAEITITIQNNGDEGATGLYYEEIVPPELEVTSTYNLVQMGNKLTWRGGIPANSEKQMTYKVKGRKKFSGQLQGELTYKAGESQKTMNANTGFKVSALFNVNFNADDFEVEVGDETRVYVTLSNNKEDDSAFYLELIIPDNMEVVASHFNDSDGKKLYMEDEVEDDEEISLTTAVKALSPGTAAFRATAIDRLSRVTDSKDFNITVSGVEPEIFFVHEDIFVNETAEFRLYLKNPSSELDMTDLNAVLESPLFNTTGKSSRFSKLKYDRIAEAEFTPSETGTYKVQASVKYTLGGEEYTASKAGVFKVISDQPEEEPEPEEEPAEEEPEEPTEEEIETIKEVGRVNRWIAWFNSVADIVIIWR